MIITVRLVGDDAAWQAARLEEMRCRLNDLPTAMAKLAEHEFDVEAVAWDETHAWHSAVVVITDCVHRFDKKLDQLRAEHDRELDKGHSNIYMIEARYAEMDTCADFYLVDGALGHGCHGEPGVDSPQDCREGSTEAALSWLVRKLEGCKR